MAELIVKMTDGTKVRTSESWVVERFLASPENLNILKAFRGFRVATRDEVWVYPKNIALAWLDGWQSGS